MAFPSGPMPPGSGPVRSGPSPPGPAAARSPDRGGHIRLRRSRGSGARLRRLGRPCATRRGGRNRGPEGAGWSALGPMGPSSLFIPTIVSAVVIVMVDARFRTVRGKERRGVSHPSLKHRGRRHQVPDVAPCGLPRRRSPRLPGRDLVPRHTVAGEATGPRTGACWRRPRCRRSSHHHHGSSPQPRPGPGPGRGPRRTSAVPGPSPTGSSARFGHRPAGARHWRCGHHAETAPGLLTDPSTANYFALAECLPVARLVPSRDKTSLAGQALLCFYAPIISHIRKFSRLGGAVNRAGLGDIEYRLTSRIAGGDQGNECWLVPNSALCGVGLSHGTAPLGSISVERRTAQVPCTIDFQDCGTTARHIELGIVPSCSC